MKVVNKQCKTEESQTIFETCYKKMIGHVLCINLGLPSNIEFVWDNPLLYLFFLFV